MGKFIQLAEDVFTRWKNCMVALSMQSDSEMADFLLNRLMTDRLREASQQESREGTPSPVTSDSATTTTTRKASPASAPALTVRGPATEDPVSRQQGVVMSRNPGHGAVEMHSSAPQEPSQPPSQTDDYAEYKHKLERRKRKPVVDSEESTIKVAKTASEIPRSVSQVPLRDASQMSTSGIHPSAGGDSSPGIIQTARVPLPTEREDGSIPASMVKRQDVIVTPQSLPHCSSKSFHGTCGEEAMDLSVRPTKDSGKGHITPPKTCPQADSEKSRDSPIMHFQSTGRGGYASVYNSSDMSDGSPQCGSPQAGFNNNKVSSSESGSDYDCCSESPVDSTQQNRLGKDDRDVALSSPKPGSNIGGIESIVQRLHQVKSETPSRSDSEDESDYYAVTFKDLIARTISRCDRYGKTQQRGKRKRGLKTSSELTAARREEITAAKKLLERVSKKKRDKFMLTVNCSTDGSEHVRNAAASEAIATLVRNVWHKENPKPIGQVIKEMVAKKLAGQEGEAEDPQGNGQSKRKGPMTIKDILNRRSDSLDNLDRSSDNGMSDRELLIVADDDKSEDLENEADLTLSAASALRKMAEVNERREGDENQPDVVAPESGQIASLQRHHKMSHADRTSSREILSKERESLDEDSDDDGPVNDLEKKQLHRRSRKKKRRWAKMFAKGIKTGETAKGSEDERDAQKSIDAEVIDSQYRDSQPHGLTDNVPSKAPKHKDDVRGSMNWPKEAAHSEGSVAKTVIQSSGKAGMETIRSLVENIQDEDEEEVDIMETKDIPLLRQTLLDQRDTMERKEMDSATNPPKEPPKSSVISHSILQILEQKSDGSDSRGRCSSVSSGTVQPLPQHAVLPEGSVIFPSPMSEAFPQPVQRPVEAEPTSSASDGRASKQGSHEEGSSEIKSISTATDYLIRFALMQNNGQRQGTVESQ